MNSPPLAVSLAAAARALAAVLAGHTPDALLARTEPIVRPAVLDLTYTALRDYGHGDFLLRRLLNRPLKDPLTHGLLLIALARLARRPDDAHTLVDQTVTAAGKPFKGLVNAVLRNYLRRQEELRALAAADEVAVWRHPRWWLERLRADHPSCWETIAAAGNEHPPMCLRVNRRRATAAGRPASAEYLVELAAAGIAGQALDDVAIVLDNPVPVERLPGFRAGRVSVQDWGAQRAAAWLDVRAGQRVLDACAAPGGKTAHLLELDDPDLTALELDPARASRIAANLTRLDLKATLRVGDAAQPASWWDGRAFDRILADVPCSASGVARRHPDIKWLRRPADVARFAHMQAAILDALWPLLIPGGKMLYCTCSVFAGENGEQIAAFLKRHANARTLPLCDSQPEIQLLPAANHDGFYFALLEKKA